MLAAASTPLPALEWPDFDYGGEPTIAAMLPHTCMQIVLMMLPAIFFDDNAN